MKVAIFLPKMSGGGIARTRAALAHGLVSTPGVEVEFVLESLTGPLQHLVPGGAGTVELGKLRFRKLIGALREYLAAARPDVLLTSKELHTFAAVIARRLTRSETRIFATMHGDFSTRLSQNRTSLERYWLPTAVRLFYGRTDGVTTVSEGVAKDLVRATGLARAKIHCLYNPFDLAAIRQAGGAQPDHPWLAEHRDMPCIVAAGRLAPQKDYPTLLRALERLRQERAVRLVILGDGPDRQGIVDEVGRLGLADVVDMPGFVENPFPYLARADLVALSSLWEGLPGVLVQALALGVPIASTDCPHGPREVLEGGALGALAPVGDPEALAAGIARMLADPPDSGRLRASAERFSQKTVTQSYLDLFEAARR
ncbi:MAG: glycosyltransferase [Paracoccaceae bacterium]